jgi:hypothetical protein
MAKRIKLITPPKDIPEGGETVMIDRVGTVYSTIAGLYHPPVTIGRGDIGETVEWVYGHGLESKFGTTIYTWLKIVVAETLLTTNDMESCLERDIWAVFVTRNPHCCDNFWQCILTVVEEVQALDKDSWQTLADGDKELYEKEIIETINRHFLRVRAGGKYAPEDDNYTVYFIVASKDFNWFQIISEFLRSTFPKKKTPEIWIGTDRRGIGREIVYYEGSGDFKYMGTAITSKTSVELMRERLSEMNHDELCCLWEQYQRFEESGSTDEQPLRELLDNQIKSDTDLCPQLTVSFEILREMANRWYVTHK